MQFGVREVFTFVMSVLQGAALRSTATVFETFVEMWELPTFAPHWTSGRWWLLRVEHLEPLLIEPMPKSNSELVHHQLEKLVEITGVPRAILNDQGSDLHGGVQLFCQNHPQTCEVVDITHKAARLLKSLLENDDSWSEFRTQASQTKFQTQQTELAFLVPPSQRCKSRYMNLGTFVTWGARDTANP